MKNKFKTIEQRENKNFFGDLSLFKEEIENKLFAFFSKDGSFWLYEAQGIYHIKYAVNNYNILISLLTQHYDKFKNYPCLLEINLNKALPTDFSSIKKGLQSLNFNIEDHHIAYIKDYFKDKEDSSDLIHLLTTNDFDNISKMLLSMPRAVNSLPKEFVKDLLNSKTNSFLGYSKNNKLLGIILFSLNENIEKIGFIRELLTLNNEDESADSISNELLNFTLNYFSIHGFSKAFYWADAKDNSTTNQFVRYGFNRSNQQMVVFSKE